MSGAILAIMLALHVQPWTHQTPAAVASRALVVYAACEAQGVSGLIGVSVAYEESRFNVEARSAVGAVGIMQVMKGHRWAWRSPALRALPQHGRERILLTAIGGAWEGCYSLAYWRERKGRDYLCHYACGNKCKPAGRKYQGRVQRRVARFLASVLGDT